MISLNLHKIVLTICPIIVFFQTLAIVGNNESINAEIAVLILSNKKSLAL